ncbi:MAG: two-component sensor histidine kinase [Bacteroidetes bacterium GWF2_38_335]|nr:MAG: two-component sensor histidine kinase [Bacteroidetes bacterium GWF2_38_335]OFY80901.1 MAG: two-component sensor histidine kinase [Bacteroidetes bacterium RIFOXYA12_FULL_38_20]HBS84937.1 two-component sensor histidine kinase [Bacteroidales bacterium]
MKTFSPKQLALIIAFVVALLSAGFQVLFIFTDENVLAKFIIVSSLSVFIVAYVLSYYIFKSFILEKIKPIYKTIHSISITDEKLTEKFEDKDIIGMVSQEVSDWAKNKTRQISELKKLEKYRKEFLGNVSHEMKTPIFNIQGYVLTLLDGGLEDDTIARPYLERTEKSINRLISIVEDLETISKLEVGELDLKIERFDIVQLVRDIFEFQEIKSNSFNVQLVIGKNAEKQVFVEADKKQIFQVITNLIVNSIKYGKEGGTTAIDFFDMDSNILVEVTDNGIGIEEKHLPRLFERFFRVDKSRSREIGGTGLGLAIVKHIIEAHNQTIHVRSKIGEGTSFAFTLKKG